MRCHVVHFICSPFQPNLVLCLNYVLCLSGLLSFMAAFLAVVLSKCTLVKEMLLLVFSAGDFTLGLVHARHEFPQTFI